MLKQYLLFLVIMIFSLSLEYVTDLPPLQIKMHLIHQKRTNEILCDYGLFTATP